MHAGILEFSFVYKAQETHSLYPHRHTIKGRFLCGCVCGTVVSNTSSLNLVKTELQEMKESDICLFLIIILNSTYIELHK